MAFRFVDPAHKEVFELYSDDPSILLEMKLESLTELRDSLARKRLPNDINEFRSALQKEVPKKTSALKQAQYILRELSRDFPDIEFYWKNTRMLRETNRYGLARAQIKRRGRKNGQRLYDYTALPSNLYSLQALINIQNDQDNLNTDEHYMSLHSNAGPSILNEALELQERYDIHHYAIRVFKSIHVARTTKKENMDLGSYHTGENKEFIPEESYKACGINEMVRIYRPMTPTRKAWHELLKEEYGINSKLITPPFNDVISLEDACEKYPELNYQKLATFFKLPINTCVAKNDTVDCDIEENVKLSNNNLLRREQQ